MKCLIHSYKDEAEGGGVNMPNLAVEKFKAWCPDNAKKFFEMAQSKKAHLIAIHEMILENIEKRLQEYRNLLS